MFMGVIVGKGKNNGVKIFTNDKKNDKLIFAFHGTPLTKQSANWLEIVETETRTDKKIFMPYTTAWTSTMSHARLVEEMDKYYQLTKQDLLDAKTIDIVAHSYGPIKALAFLHAIAKDKENAPKILAKVKNLHLYNGLINTEFDSNHDILHNIKLFMFKIRILFASLLRGELKPEMPDVVKSLITLEKLPAFEPHTLIAYNPEDAAAPSSEPFMNKVRTELKQNIAGISVINDSKLHRYPVQGRNHSTSSGIVERFERTEEKIKAQAAK
jgi:hypothetical protein